MDLLNPFLIEKLEASLKKDPSSKSFCSLAQIYCSQFQFQKAEAVCLKGLDYNPSYAQGYVILAEVYKTQGKMEQALKMLHKAQELNPDNPNIYKNLAEIYRKRNNVEKTLNAYKMLNFLNPGNKLAQFAIPHLEKLLGTQSLNKDSKEKGLKSSSLQKKKGSLSGKGKSFSHLDLSLKERERLLKLRKILARIENYIK